MSTSASSRSFISCPCPMFQCVRAHVRAHACTHALSKARSARSNPGNVRGSHSACMYACIQRCAFMLACVCDFRREGWFARLFGC